MRIKTKFLETRFYYSNLGVKEISFNVLSTSENRYNQHRTSSFGTPTTIVTTSEAYDGLDLMESTDRTRIRMI